MLPRSWKRPWRSRARRSISALVLVAYVLVGIGVPVPRVVASDLAKPNAPAGRCCRGAQKCCCSGQHHAAPRTCCDASHARGRSGCCDGKEAAAPAQPAAPTTPSRLALVSLRCPCTATLWLSMGSVLPAIPTPAWAPLLVADGWIAHVDLVGPSLQVIPPDPPPRLS